MENSIDVVCRACGKAFSVPADLESYICIYCGERTVKEEVPAPQSAAEDVPVSDETDREFVEAHLVDCIDQFDSYNKRFTKKEYEDAYYEYLAGIRPIFEAMDRYVRANADRRDELICGFVNRFLDDRVAYHQTSKLWKLQKNSLLFASKIVIALYMTPAIREMALSVSEDFATTLHTEFVKRYPNDKYIPTTHEEIAAGFRTRKLCFITTAVCEFEGKGDDCAELTAFRGFRDGWLAAQPDGKALTEEYYRIAPAIVSMIDFCDDRETVYGQLRDRYLQPCFDAIGRQDYADCKQRYVRMVRELQSRYGVS